MYCHQCGKEVGEAKYCPYCGTKLIYDGNEDMYTNSQYMNNVSSNDAPSTGFAILSFCFPIVGIILFIIWNKDYPQKAKSCLKGFIAGIPFEELFKKAYEKTNNIPIEEFIQGYADEKGMLSLPSVIAFCYEESFKKSAVLIKNLFKDILTEENLLHD